MFPLRKVRYRMANKQVITVWGSPGSGKTLTSIKIARELAARKKNVVVVLCDSETPAVPLVVPDAKGVQSLGNLLSMPTFNQISVFQHFIPVGKNLSLLGYLLGENEKTWPEYDISRAKKLIALLRNIADFVVIDCPHHLLSSVMTAAALEDADLVLRVVNADPKSLIFIKSQRSLLQDPRFRFDQHIRIINNVLPKQDANTYEDVFGGKTYILPHLPTLQMQYQEARLMEPVAGREGRLYEPRIKTIVQEEICNE